MNATAEFYGRETCGFAEADAAFERWASDLQSFAILGLRVPVS